MRDEVTPELAAVEFACRRAQVIQQLLRGVEMKMRRAQRDWAAVDIGEASAKEIVEAWKRQRGAGWLHEATNDYVEFVTHIWRGLSGFRRSDVVGRLELLTCLDDADRTLASVPLADGGECARRATLAHAARMFELGAPRCVGRLKPVDWEAALTEWQRQTGRPRGVKTKKDAKSPNRRAREKGSNKKRDKWIAVAKFAEKAGFPRVAAGTFKHQWAAWKRGLVSSTLFFGADEGDKTVHDAGSKSPGDVGHAPGRRSRRNP